MFDSISYSVPTATEKACAEGAQGSISNNKFLTTTSVDLGVEAPKYIPFLLFYSLILQKH